MKLSPFADTTRGKGGNKDTSVPSSYIFAAPQGDLQRKTYSNAATAAEAESLTVPAGTFAAPKPHSTDTFTHADGTTRIISGTDWMDVATLEFPLFSGRLSILIS